jgi:hypothetical protein
MITRIHGCVEAILPADQWLIIHSSANKKQRASVYDSESGRFVRELVAADYIGHFSGRLALSPDRRTLFSTFEAGIISQIDIETGRVLRSKATPLHENIKRDGGPIVASPDGRIVWFLVWGSVFAWNLETDELTELPFKTFANNDTGMVASPRGDVLWADGRRLYRFELATGASFELDHNNDRELTTDIVYLAGDRLAIGWSDGQVEIRRAAPDAKLEDTVRIGPKAFHKVRLASLRGGSILAASAADQRVSLLARGDKTARFRIDDLPSEILSLASDGRDRLWVGDYDGGVFCFEISDDQIKQAPQKPARLPMTHHITYVADHETPIVKTGAGKAVSVGGNRMMAGAPRDLCAWERGAKDAVRYRLIPYGNAGLKVAISARDFVVFDEKSGFLVVDARTLAKVTSLAHKGSEGAALSPAGDRLVTTGGTEIKVWSTEAWSVIASRQGPDVPLKAIQWCDADDRVLYADKNGSFGLFSAAFLKRRAMRRLPSSSALSANRAGTLVACEAAESPDTRAAYLWDVASDSVLKLASDTRSPAFIDEDHVAVVERRGRYVASISKDGAEARRIELGAAMTLSGKEATTARLAVDGERAAVICETTAYRESPFQTPPELAVVDLASGAILLTHTFERDIGSVKFDGDALVYATSGGRVAWLPL